MIVGPSHVINPSLYRKLSYDALRDFSFVTQLALGSYLVVVHPSLPVKIVQELVAFAKSRKEGVTYASPGVGQAGQLGMELFFKMRSSFEAVHVLYKGAGPAFVDLMAGRVDVFMPATSGALPHVRSGKLEPVSVTSLKRSPLLPNVPTVAESDFPGYEVIGIYGLLAPAGLPPAVMAALHACGRAGERPFPEMAIALSLPVAMWRIASGGGVNIICT